ncbi:WD40 repeat domain-containing protein [bacterium]|nr:WD40 repeat domain-containing protein [bacterium]
MAELRLTRLWAPEEGSGRVTAGAVSPDGEWAATAEGNQVRLIRLASGETAVQLVAGLDRILSLAFSDDTGGLWAGTDSADEHQTLWHWSLPPSSRKGLSRSAHYRTSALACRGNRLLTGGGEDDGNWTLWSLPEMTLLAEGGDDVGEVLSVALTEAGWGILKTEQDGLVVEFWRADDQRRSWSSRVSDGVHLAFSPSGETLYALAGPSSQPFSVATGKAGKPLRGLGLKLTGKGLAGASVLNGEIFAAPDAASAQGRLLHWGGGGVQAWQGKRLLWKRETPSPALLALACQPDLPWVGGMRGSLVALWDEQGRLQWTYDLGQACHRLALDDQGRWLGIPGETVRYLNLNDGSLAHQGPENFAAGSGAFGCGTIYPEFQPWKTDHPDLWTPALATYREWAVTWAGGGLDLRHGTKGPTYQGLGAIPTQITVTHTWVGLSNDTWVAVFDKELGQMLRRLEAWGNASSGVAYSRTGCHCLRARFQQLQFWNLNSGQMESCVDTPFLVTSVAGWGPYFAGDSQGSLYRVELI